MKKHLLLPATAAILLLLFMSGYRYRDKKNNIIHENMIMENGKKKDSTFIHRKNQAKNPCPPPYNFTIFEDPKGYYYDSLEIDEINYGKKVLIDQGYKFPSEEEFSKRILEVYGINIDEYPNKIIVLNNDLFPLIAIKAHRYILYDYSDNDKDAYGIDKTLLYRYNDFIFHDSRKGYEYLLADEQMLIDLVTVFGYTGNKELTDYVFNNYKFLRIMEIGFRYDPCSKKSYLRENVFDAVERFALACQSRDFADTFKRRVFGDSNAWIQKIISGEYGQYHNPEQTVAYIFERQLRVGVKGFLIKHLADSPDYETFLKKNNCFGYPHLKEFMEKQY